MKPHRIHLKGPWNFAWLIGAEAHSDDVVTATDADTRKKSQRIRMPVDWISAFGQHFGCIRFRRSFHCPTNLESDDHVHVVFDGIGGCAQVSMNGERLGTVEDGTESAEFEVTACLQPRNELVVEIEFLNPENTDQKGGLWGPVAIEIRDSP